MISRFRLRAKKLINTTHYKAKRILKYDFEKKDRFILKTCKRARPSEWAKYSQANFVIQTIQMS